MLINPRKEVFFLTAILLFAISTFLPLARADQTEATAALASAREQILTCYQAAKEAEGAGANITALVTLLNDAGAFLSRAESAYSLGDFDTARNLAVQSQSTLDNFVPEANNLKQTATQQQDNDFLINVVVSLVAAFGVAGVGAWIFLKGKYETAGAYENESSKV